ncbi:MAG: phosphate ABC transporter substrate-binding protein [Candidatus Eisenbacteria bacterium]|nr:phosphate ABC transporter substrate-binding protein [Candidatus Eisenbacteria bacterium]
MDMPPFVTRGRRTALIRAVRIVSVMAAALLHGCGAQPRAGRDMTPETIRMKGSDTMRILAERWAAAYMAQPGAPVIYVEGGGTRSGVEALIAGQVEICCASRTLEAEEIQRLWETYQSLGFKFLCAKDALSIYLHPQNPVRDLSLHQLSAIMTGRISHWSEAGGEDRPIRVIIREPNSGTRAFIREHLLKGASYAAQAETIAGTRAVADTVAADPGAIGFGGLAYGPHVYHCRIEGVAPAEDAVRDGSYPIARYLYLYTVNRPRGDVKAFIDWVLSAPGQRIVADVGYVPLWERPQPR